VIDVATTRSRTVGVVGRGRVGAALAGLLTELPSTNLIRVVSLDEGDPLDALGECEVVVEAVPEDLALKRSVITAIQRAAGGAVALSTTSSLTAAELSAGAPRPDHIGCWHPFTPLERRRFVEVVVDERLHPDVIEAARWLARTLDRSSIDVRDTTGFVANRILKRWTHAGLALVDDGAAPATVDAAWRACGFRRGPLSVVSLVGPATSLAVSRRFVDAFGDRFAPPASLAQAAADPAALAAAVVPPTNGALGTVDLSSAHAAIRDETHRILAEGACLSGREGVRTALLEGLAWPADVVDALLAA
jgi:3-hydroxybutyryl-CoA dehydrogenase